MQKISVVVADQHPIVRSGVSHLLRDAKIQVVGEAEDGRAAVKLVKQHSPTVIILDTVLPLFSGILVSGEVLKHHSGTRIIWLTADTSDNAIQMAMQIGIHGYIYKSSPITTYTEAVLAVAKGQTWFERDVAQIMAHYAHLPGYTRTLQPLTDRELEVLALIGAGKSWKEIATLLSISQRTVANHTAALSSKLRIRDNVGLAKYAIKYGLVPA